MTTTPIRTRCPECGRDDLDIFEDDYDVDDSPGPPSWWIECLDCGWTDLATDAEVDQP